MNRPLTWHYHCHVTSTQVRSQEYPTQLSVTLLLDYTVNMNLLIIDEPYSDKTIVRVTGRQLSHLLTVRQSVIGDSIRVGRLNGYIGRGEIITINDEFAELRLTLDEAPPNPLPLVMILALPRPKMMRRIIQSVASMGVKKLYLINSYKVEKSFWQSPLMQPDSLHQELILGLEQSVDTTLPDIVLKKRFLPFVEDELPDIIKGHKALVAHPGSINACPINTRHRTCIAIGPEGGFIPYEIQKLANLGFEPVHLGPRILRVETAVPSLISRLYPA